MEGRRSTSLMLLLLYALLILALLILVVSVLLVLIISILQENNIPLRKTISKKPVVLRWAIYYTAILAIILFGAYGVGYVPVEPMYAGF